MLNKTNTLNLNSVVNENFFNFKHYCKKEKFNQDIEYLKKSLLEFFYEFSNKTIELSNFNSYISK